MKFFMDVYEHAPGYDPINIQHREYDGRQAPSDCTDAMKIAENYYTLKAMAVDIVMTDEQKRLIAKIEVKP